MTINKYLLLLVVLTGGLSLAFISHTDTDPMISVSANKMNVFFIGVDNPLTIETTAGIDIKDLTVTSKSVELRKSGDGKYNVIARKPGQAAIKVQHPNLPTTVFEFRVKRIPDPVAVIANGKTGGTMGIGEFKAQGGVATRLDNFDFDAKCQIAGYELTKISVENNKVIKEEKSVNGGARYNDKSKRMVNLAKPGDYFTYTNVKARCPGDMAGRRINTLAFKIK